MENATTAALEPNSIRVIWAPTAPTAATTAAKPRWTIAALATHAAIRCAAASVETLSPLALAKRSWPIACRAQNDGECDDGGHGADHDACPYGTDCNDCTDGVAALRVTRAIIPMLFCCCCCGAPSPRETADGCGCPCPPATHAHRSRRSGRARCAAVGLGIFITQQKRRRARFAVHGVPASYQQRAPAAQCGGYPASMPTAVPTPIPVAQGNLVQAQPVVVGAYIPAQPPVVQGTAVVA